MAGFIKNSLIGVLFIIAIIASVISIYVIDQYNHESTISKPNPNCTYISEPLYNMALIVLITTCILLFFVFIMIFRFFSNRDSY
jgi:hypothetical protein